MPPTIHCAHTDIVPIEKVIPNPRNPNQHPENQIVLLAKIIEAQGWRVPITVSKRSGFIVRGHGRLMAARKLNLSEVPVDYQDYASEAEEWADLIADNRLSELSEIDHDILKELLQEIDNADFDMELTGFGSDELAELMAELPIDTGDADDFDPVAEAEQITEPTSKPGDIWQLGRHRLMCGDSTVLTDVEKLMDGQQADMVFTDPPYNVNYESENGKKIQNDHMDSDSFYRFLLAAFTCMEKVTKPGGAVYICHADSEGSNFRGAMREAGWLVKQCIIWVKNQFVMGRQDYQWKHEPILYGWKPGTGHKWYGGRKQSTIIDEAPGVTVREEADGIVLTFSTGIHDLTIKVPSYEVLHQGDDSLTTIWRFEKPTKNGDHPTMKPVGIPARAIKNSCKPGDIVLDLFGGGGSTLVAAEQTGRSARIMELDPVYVDVQIKRWEEFTGQKAILLNT
ncbi:site-specific DNA-methyltransferase [Heliobacterium chlorum]|uniref:Site-specific DNA-methyltransferase n=1 Tax=Heliobacterium chlorum TaxID=2698 RepID=A0ABR7T117_HELCL|nr:site-specific DNA-methyltransferase [Heliobacterium chlorum]MBC9783534.1 site-specific DNA-methyltransferase [Heliobacterium chlorum]